MVLKLVVCELFEISYNVTNGDKILDFVIVNLDRKLFFAKENKVSKLKRVNAKVVFKFSFESNIVSINRKFINKKCFYFIKHF